MKKFKIVAVIGARPQFVKAAAIVRAWRKSPAGRSLSFVWVHTGQHYDHRLSGIFFKELSLPKPRYDLRVGSLPHASQTGRMLSGIEKVLRSEKPDMVLVFGDTNSTLAGALAAAKLCIPVAHVEAGLRSFNRALPEELNRVVTDRISDLFFCPTASAVRQLAHEGITRGVFLVGDVMADVLRQHHKIPAHTNSRPYYLATIHRNTNTDTPSRLARIFRALDGLDEKVVLPLHPRTAGKIQKNERLRKTLALAENIRTIQPVSYEKMLALEKTAKGILTDSGGVQKEAFLLRVPCVTLRTETEWPETLRYGWNELCEPSAKKILKSFARIKRRRGRTPAVFGRGNAALKIIQILKKDLEARKRP